MAPGILLPDDRCRSEDTAILARRDSERLTVSDLQCVDYENNAGQAVMLPIATAYLKFRQGT